MKIMLDLNDKEIDKLTKAARTAGLKKVASSIESAAKTDDPVIDQKYRDAVPVRDGSLECDGEAIVSKGNEAGAYVQCWVWVSDKDAGIEEEDE